MARTLVQYRDIQVFGLFAASRILRTTTLSETSPAGLGLGLTVRIADATGSHRVAFELIVVLIFVAFIAAMFVLNERARLARAAT